MLLLLLLINTRLELLCVHYKGLLVPLDYDEEAYYYTLPSRIAKDESSSITVNLFYILSQNS